MINWPAIIKHSGDAELVYINDQSEWALDADLHLSNYDETDCLIDSSGYIFILTHKEQNYVIPKANGHTMALNEILGLIKAHVAQNGSCCVAKLYAPTISDAYKILESQI